MVSTRNSLEANPGPDRLMTHLAMQEVDDSGSPVTWGEQVSGEEYRAAPSPAS
jgi:hypothetical protein